MLDDRYEVLSMATDGKCIFCGSELSSGDVDGICRNCKDAGMDKMFDPPSYEGFPMYGWVCPRCGAVHAPFVRGCDCPPPSETFTTYSINIDSNGKQTESKNWKETGSIQGES